RRTCAIGRCLPAIPATAAMPLTQSLMHATVFRCRNRWMMRRRRRSSVRGWGGASDDLPPEPLDAAIIFAPVGALVPLALAAVRKGGRVVCGGIHMSDIPSFPYRLLWEERHLLSGAHLTRRDAVEFLSIAPQAGVETQIA